MIKNDLPLTAELIANHGLSPEEFDRIREIIGRDPTYTELGIFSAMWNEHCSYKSSKKWLRTLPTTGPQVIQGPGENAGVVDIGDGQAVVFKMESHNHPSYIEPYQGAATGVGGILRDIFTMGARPVAAMNALRFGSPDHHKTRHLVSGVVGGVGGYGNSFGVPTVGGEVNFDARYDGNILVNAFAAGICDTDAIFYSRPDGVGFPVVYLGAKTGRDGVGGATMASAEFDDQIEEKRPTVQVGDPFTEKRLLDACLELMATGAVIAIQDMGAAGLTCSAVEMGAKGNLGIELDLDAVPCRETAMTAYEMMLSESQERMLMVLRPEKEAEARAVFDKWELDFAIVGKTTDDLRFRIRRFGDICADLPILDLGDQAPEYDRPYVLSEPAARLAMDDLPACPGIMTSLHQLIGSPDLCSRRWVFEQYDTLIQGNTAQTPGGDAGVVRVDGTNKGLAFSCDVTPRYCESDPLQGGRQAVAEVFRNLSSVGAKPLAVTDCLNFGNPEKEKIMGQLVGCLQGISEACVALDMPIVSGNVSLYNETNGQAIPPTPAMAGVGLLAEITQHCTSAFKMDGDVIVLIGGHATDLGQSIYAKTVLGVPDGAPPAVMLEVERRHGDFIRIAILSGEVTACHDISDGGLLVALAEMAMPADLGCAVSLPEEHRPDTLAYGEDQARYLVTLPANRVAAFCGKAKDQGIPCDQIGTIGGDELTVAGHGSISVVSLKRAHENWFPTYMDDK
jgi:phosphoribosylformylglycinamidine synthase